MNREERKQWYFEQTHKIIDGIIHKQCTKCEEWLPETVEYFYMRNKSKPERGFNSECKECTKVDTKRWQQEINPSKYKEIKRIYKENNFEKYNNGISNWRKNNKEYISLYNKEYQNKHPDKIKEYNAYRQMHKKHIINKQEWQACKDYFNNECAYCGLLAENHTRTYKGELQVIDLHKEHVDHNGLNDLSNCIPSCQSCNSTKNRKSLDEFYNPNNLNFIQERYDRIMKWLTEDYKLYIEPPKPKGKYNRKVK